MIKKILPILLSLSLTGCIFINSAPEDNSEFSSTTRIQDFKGVYRNVGDPKSIYLTYILWKDRSFSKPTDPLVKDERGNLIREEYIVDNLGRKITDREIEYIEVLSTDNSVKVNAIKDGCIISSKEYLGGRDFSLAEGKIVLHKETYVLTRGGVGDVLLGPSYEKTELGLDARGNGKYKSQGYFAGIVFMLFPMAGGGTDEVKFEKIDTNIKFDNCK